MTVNELSGILRRRWYVVVFGLALLAGAVAYAASRPGVYWTQVDVVILAPTSARYPNVIEQTSQSLIAMAGLIERDANRGITAPATATSNVSLAGEGVREGYSIRLPNEGGQWANNFNRPVLDVQVTGADPAAVRAKLTALVDRVTRELEVRQDEQNIPRSTRITAVMAPEEPAVLHLRGSRIKAFGATVLLGIGLIPACTVGVDRLLTNRARRRQGAAITTPPTGVSA